MSHWAGPRMTRGMRDFSSAEYDTLTMDIFLHGVHYLSFKNKFNLLEEILRQAFVLQQCVSLAGRADLVQCKWHVAQIEVEVKELAMRKKDTDVVCSKDCHLMRYLDQAGISTCITASSCKVERG